MLHDVVVVWPGSCNNVALGHAHKYWANNVAMCCADMLRSFDLGLREHKERKLSGHVYLFILFVSPRPYYQAEF